MIRQVVHCTGAIRFPYTLLERLSPNVKQLATDIDVTNDKIER